MSKVMLVEDDNNLREIYEARLQAEGYDIVTAKDGEEALVVAKAEQPELVISDVMMPKISGFEMLDILRNTDGLKHVKVIMLTALGQSDDQDRADRLGADRYLVKSQVTLEDIVKVAHDLLDGDTATADAIAGAAAAQPDEPSVIAPTPIEQTAVPAVDPVASPTPTPLAIPPEPVAVQPVIPEPVAVAPEPVVALPTPVLPEPTAAPAISQPDPGVIAATDVSNEASNDAQSTADEEAALEANIENFVEGASSDATAPQAALASEPTKDTANTPTETPDIATIVTTQLAAESVPSTAEPSDTPAPAAPITTEQSVQANDDSVMAEALDTLAANTAPVPEAAAPPTATDSQPASAVPGLPNIPRSAGGHGLVLQPLPTSAGPQTKDINALLAAEDAKVAEAAAAPQVVNPASIPVPAPEAPVPVAIAVPVQPLAVAPEPATPPTPVPTPAPVVSSAAPATEPVAPTTPSVDPNSIAL
jgi:CheY-like chemotaxis protein